MSRRLLLVLLVLFSLGASAWWAAGQFIRWRELQTQASRLRGEISAQIGELRRLPRKVPTLPDPAQAQQMLAEWTGELRARDLAVRTSVMEKNPHGLGFSTTFVVPGYQDALDEIDRLHRLDPVAVTTVTIQKKEQALYVTFDGYIATAPARPVRRGEGH